MQPKTAETLKEYYEQFLCSFPFNSFQPLGYPTTIDITNLFQNTDKQTWGGNCNIQCRKLQNILQQGGRQSDILGTRDTLRQIDSPHTVLTVDKSYILDPGLSIPSPIPIPKSNEEYEATYNIRSGVKLGTVRLYRKQNSLYMTRHDNEGKRNYEFAVNTGTPLTLHELEERYKKHMETETYNILSVWYKENGTLHKDSAFYHRTQKGDFRKDFQRVTNRLGRNIENFLLAHNL